MVSFHVHGNLVSQIRTKEILKRQNTVSNAGGVGKTTTRSCDDVSQVGPFQQLKCVNPACLDGLGFMFGRIHQLFMGIHGCEKWESMGIQGNEKL